MVEEFTKKEVEIFEKESKARIIRDEEWEIYENQVDFLETEEVNKLSLLSFIKNNPEISNQELVKLSKLSSQAVDWLIDQLEQENKIIKKYEIVQ